MGVSLQQAVVDGTRCTRLRSNRVDERSQGSRRLESQWLLPRTGHERGPLHHGHPLSASPHVSVPPFPDDCAREGISGR